MQSNHLLAFHFYANKMSFVKLKQITYLKYSSTRTCKQSTDLSIGHFFLSHLIPMATCDCRLLRVSHEPSYTKYTISRACLLSSPGVGNLFTITGRMNRALSLAGGI